jgi:hypothetical protein
MHSLGKCTVLSLLILANSALPQDYDARTVDVCTVLQTLSKFDGKVVAIRGEYQVGREAAALYGTECSGEVELSGGKWPWAVHVLFSSGTPALGDEALSSLRRLGTGTRGVDFRKTRILVTLVGRVTSARNNATYASSRGPRPAGFGQGNIFPAEISVTAADDIRVEERSPQKKTASRQAK